MRSYVYTILTSQVQGRSSIVGNSAPVVDAYYVFKSMLKVLINKDYSIGIDIERYQGVLEYLLSKVDFSVSTGVCMLPRNLHLNIGKTKRYNNKILVSNADMKIGSDKDINKDRKKSPPDVPKTVVPVARIDPVGVTKLHNLKILTEKHNDEKLDIIFLIEGTGLFAFHFW